MNTHIKEQPVRSYVLMGDEPGTGKVHPDAQLTLYNSAFWGSPVVGSIVNNGTLRLQQGNFASCGAPGIDVRGGQAHVYTTYFARPMPGKAESDDATYARLHAGGSLIELTNNYYVSPLRPVSDEPDRVQGSDVEQKTERATASAGSLNNLH